MHIYAGLWLHLSHLETFLLRMPVVSPSWWTRSFLLMLYYIKCLFSRTANNFNMTSRDIQAPLTAFTRVLTEYSLPKGRQVHCKDWTYAACCVLSVSIHFFMLALLLYWKKLVESQTVMFQYKDRLKTHPEESLSFQHKFTQPTLQMKAECFTWPWFKSPRGSSVVSTPKNQNISLSSEISYILCINLQTSKWVQ